MKKMSIFALLLAAVVMTSYSVSGTYAKYTSEFTGTDSARVAKWAFNIGDQSDMTAETFTFDLFNTVKDTANDATEGDISATDGSIIAPGTTGSFGIVLVNNSEVNATYTIDYSVTNPANIPVEYSLGEIDGNTTWYSDIDELSVEDIAINKDGGSETITVYWRWAFEGTQSSNFTGTQTDKTDTALGIDGLNKTISAQAVVTVNQVD